MNSPATHPAPEELMALFDGELSTDRAQAVSSHMSQCTECSAVLAAFPATAAALRGWSISPVPERIGKTILHAEACSGAGTQAKLRLSTRIGRWSWKQWAAGLGLAATSLVLVAAISIPNLMRSKMANEAALQKSRARLDGASVSDYVGTGSSFQREPLSNQFASVASNRISEQELESTKNDLEMARRTLQAQVAPATPAPMIARSASLTLLVRDFSSSRAALDGILAKHHAYAAELKASTVEDAPRSLVAFLRVPANDLGPTLAELKSLGRLQEETQNGEEVTQQHADLIARLKNSREAEQRLQAILAQRTGKISDVLEVEQELTRVRGGIESMEGELKVLNHRIEFASVNLILNEQYQASISLPPFSVGARLRNALVAGFRNAGETVLAIVLFLAEFGLTILIWFALIAVPVIWFLRRYRRKLAAS